MRDFVGPYPSSSPAPGTGTDTPSGVSAPKQSPPRVLCVDDDLFTLSNLSRVLRGRFAVVARDNPVHALSLLEREGDFAVVVVANMPEMDAVEFLDIARERSPTTTHILLRSKSSIGPAHEPPRSPFRVLTRPFSTDELLATVEAAAQYHSLLSASPVQPVEASVTSEVGPRVGLRLPGRTIELLPGVTSVGRSRTCHVCVDAPVRAGRG
jgi:CheY-like chemotaxis protein